ncbi:DUF6600 domain-containing protein [Variovorax terrae]|uniref:Chromosome partitioning protein ParA n=1 Tax=Variovorax terrae TaxID=2923278 RepID=A0A9X1VX50_9BURK|nr:DUF6600 domain-containing protein [Variovorax terrae]MCJ0764845.1 chromosome partitioning protein ParA [Variovorax terrae]
MTHRFTPFPRLRAWSVGLMLLTASVLAFAQADPPGRVARLNYFDGAVSFSAAGSGAWTDATLNRPLTAGDRLWTDGAARAEMHVGATALRLNGQSSLDITALDDQTAQFSLMQGTLNVRLRTLYPGERVEIDTPNLAVTLDQPGDYRVDVDPQRGVSQVTVQSGGGTAWGENGESLGLASRQQIAFSGRNLAQVSAQDNPARDAFDLWAADRDRREDQSVSARYVSRDTIGYEQLDSYGDWQTDPGYGAVWVPRVAVADWAPYRYGHWDWIAPWGWTWIDDAPWGFAPFHYGRWAYVGARWAWVPGRLAPRPVYAPALVAFMGGSSGGVNWNISIGGGHPGVAWFPLGPGEAYRPAYTASPTYVTNLNRTVIVNRQVNVTNVYVNQRRPEAVTAIAADDFGRGRPVRGNFMRLPATALAQAQVGVAPPTPGRGGLPAEAARPAPPRAMPPTEVLNRQVIARRPPPALAAQPSGGPAPGARPPGAPPHAPEGPAAHPPAGAQPPTREQAQRPPQAGQDPRARQDQEQQRAQAAQRQAQQQQQEQMQQQQRQEQSQRQQQMQQQDQARRAEAQRQQQDQAQHQQQQQMQRDQMQREAAQRQQQQMQQQQQQQQQRQEQMQRQQQMQRDQAQRQQQEQFQRQQQQAAQRAAQQAQEAQRVRAQQQQQQQARQAQDERRPRGEGPQRPARGDEQRPEPRN